MPCPVVKMMLAVLSGILLTLTPAGAGEYPEKNITLICTHRTGGDTDFNARLLARHLEHELGMPVVVNNVTGANGSIALNQYRDASPDGYTLIATNTMAMACNRASGLSDFGYDAFEPVAIYGRQGGENIVVRADAPYRTLAELLEAARDEPDRIRLGVVMGGSSYVAALIMQKDRGAEFNLVETGGDASGRLTALLGGHIEATIVPYALVRDYLRDGQLRALATLMPTRLKEAPDIPTAAESGLPNLTLETMYGIFAPRGTAAGIVEKLNAAICKIVATDVKYRKDIEAFNLQEPLALNVADTIARLRRQSEHLMSYAMYLQ